MASIYAFKFNHFYNRSTAIYASQDIFSRTWELFTGPVFYKDTVEGIPSFPVQPINFRTEDNIIINAWYSPTAFSKGCILFFHSMTSSKKEMEGEAIRFKEWGYSVLLVDFRGHGKSGGDHGTYGDKETDEVQKAFQFAKSMGYSNIILYGSSFGASVCIKAAAEKKVLPNAIIADMPFASLHDHFAGKIQALGFPTEPFAFLVTMWTGIENGYNGLAYDVKAYSKKLNCPVMVAYGEKDNYVAKKQMDVLFQNLPEHNRRMAVYTSSNHSSYLSTDPIAWEKEITSFLHSLS